MRIFFRLRFVLLVFTLSMFSGDLWGQATPPERWEADIQKFETQDRSQPPIEGGILFYGSSSIRLWDLAACFPGEAYVNRGFGGSQMADAVFFAERVVIPHKPKYLFVYEGDNDIASGKTPEQVLTDFQQLIQKVHSKSPKTQIVYISIKTSPKRWNLATEMRRSNDLIRRYAHQFAFLHCIDADTPLMRPDGAPNQENYKEDELHLSEKGYAIWTRLINEFMEKNTVSE